MPSDSQRATTARRTGPVDAWLTPVLVANGVVTPRQGEALAASTEGSIWDGALANGATDSAIVAALSRAFRVAPAELERAEPRTTTLLPETLARKHHVVPVRADDRSIRIATADPRDLDVEQTLRFVTGRDVVFEIASPRELAASGTSSIAPSGPSSASWAGSSPPGSRRWTRR